MTLECYVCKKCYKTETDLQAHTLFDHLKYREPCMTDLHKDKLKLTKKVKIIYDNCQKSFNKEHGFLERYINYLLKKVWCYDVHLWVHVDTLSLRIVYDCKVSFNTEKWIKMLNKHQFLILENHCRLLEDHNREKRRIDQIIHHKGINFQDLNYY